MRVVMRSRAFMLPVVGIPRNAWPNPCRISSLIDVTLEGWLTIDKKIIIFKILYLILSEEGLPKNNNNILFLVFSRRLDGGSN